MSFDESDSILKIDITNHSHWPNYFNMHQHGYYEMYYLISGSVKYTIENNSYEVSDGDIVIVPPNVSHVTRPNTSERHRRIIFFVKPNFIKKFLTDNPDMTEFYSRQRILKPDENDAKYFKTLSDTLLDEYLSNQAYSLTAQRGIFSALLVHFKRIYDKTSMPSSTKQENRLPLLDAPTEIKILHSFINDNFCEKIDLNELAEQVYLSPVYISSIFTKYFGMSFKKYLLNLRINKSKELLKTTGRSIESIAFDCGFNSCNHFCKTFKNSVGMPPKMYRETRSDSKK